MSLFETRRMLKLTVVIASLLVLAPLANAEPTLPEDDANPGATRSQAVQAFVKDCHANLLAPAWDESGEERNVPECEALTLQQNCNPDTYGCYGGYQSCQLACQPTCTKCQGTCATTCDDCKSTCNGDKACTRKCAEGRADCRDRCLKGRRECQGPQCDAASVTCESNGLDRASRCDRAACTAYVECRDAQEDYETVEKVCAPKARTLDAFCMGVCEMEGYIPSSGSAATMLATPENGATLARHCTAAAQCPPDYAAIAPYLGSLCSGATTDASFATLAATVKRGGISKRTLSLVFNAYGAIHGYEFKKELWMNGFFYGEGSWLPASCRAKMKTVASAKVMPFYLTKLRDRVKTLWSAKP